MDTLKGNNIGIFDDIFIYIEYLVLSNHEELYFVYNVYCKYTSNIHILVQTYIISILYVSAQNAGV